MQRSVISALQSHSSDPLDEDESIPDFGTFAKLGCGTKNSQFKSLDAVKLVIPLHGHQELILRNPEEPEDDVVMDDTEEAFYTVLQTHVNFLMLFTPHD